MPNIFISYRRTDTKPLAKAIADRLSTYYGAENVFFDNDSLTPGINWPETVRKKVQTCDIMLVLIGSQWQAEMSSRASKTERDWVFEEIFTGLSNPNVTVIPVLCDGTKYLKRENLLPYIEPLADLQPYEGFKTILIKRDSEIKLEVTNTILDEIVAQLKHTLDRLPILYIFRSGLESAHHQLQSLKTDTKDLLDLQKLIDELNGRKLKPKPKDNIQIDELKFRLYGNRLEYKELLLEIIKITGVLLWKYHNSLKSQPTPSRVAQLYAFKQLSNLLQSASERLAEADASREADVERNNYGYKALVKLTATDSGSEAGGYRDAGMRGLAFYEEHYKPPAKEFREIWHGKSRSEIITKQFNHTWTEFVPEEALGSFMIAVVFAFAFAMHLIISQNFTIFQEASNQSGSASESCWLVFEPYRLPRIERCLRGAIYDGLMWVGVLSVGLGFVHIYNKSRSQNLKRIFSRWLIAGITCILIDLYLILGVDEAKGSINSMGLVQLGAGFLAIAMLSLPGSVLMLGLVGWSSVIAGERKYRITPNVNWWMTYAASIAGFTLTFLLFAAVIEKSRPYLLESTLFGAMWGLALGIGIWWGRRAYETPQNEHNYKPNVYLWQRLLTILIFSAVFTVIMGQLTHDVVRWPRKNQFLAISSLPDPLAADGKLNTQTQPIDQFFNTNGSLITIDRTLMLGLWIGTAVFLGMEIMNGKMQNEDHLETTNL